MMSGLKETLVVHTGENFWIAFVIFVLRRKLCTVRCLTCMLLLWITTLVPMCRLNFSKLYRTNCIMQLMVILLLRLFMLVPMQILQ